MPHESELMTRREFVGKSIQTLGTLWMASQVYSTLEEPPQQERSLSIPQIASLERRQVNSSSEIYGGITNAASMPYDSDPEMIDTVIHNMQKMDSKFIRFYVHPDTEKPIGNFNLEYITQLADSISQVYSRSNEQIKSIVCIDDLFYLLHSMNNIPFYGTAPLSHPTLNNASQPEEIAERQYDFFTKPVWAEAYRRKTKVFFEALAPVNHMIAAWEAFNEPEIPFQTDDKMGALTEFYDRMLGAIRQNDPDKPIITGLANPSLINPWDLLKYNIINSAHVYKGKEQAGLDRYIDEMIRDPMLPPVVLEECGFPSVYFNRKIPQWAHDVLLSKTIRNLFIRNTRIDQTNKIASFGISALGVWQLKTNRKSEDGFQFDPKTYPRSATAIQEVNQILTFN